MSDAKTVVYVYGTLRNDPPKGTVHSFPGSIYSMGFYPALKLGEGQETNHFICERLEVTEEQLERLDMYEGYQEEYPEHSLFVRQNFSEGFIYVYNGDVNPSRLISSGDWLEIKGQVRNVI